MAVDKRIVDEQIKALGPFYQNFTKKEIQYLPQVMIEGETIKALTSGLHNNNTWLIAATDRRILFLDKGMIYGLRQIEIPLKQITSVSHSTGLLAGTIKINTAGGLMQINNIAKKDATKVADIISELMRQAQASRPSAPADPKVDIATQLEKLAALKEKGILTDAEFQEQKAKLLHS